MNNLKNNINDIVEILKKGGVAIFPTDTVYGIGALPDKEAVRRLYRIKKRDFSKKIIALIDNPDKLEVLTSETGDNIDRIKKVIEECWPGELTIIFKANEEFTEKFDSGLKTVGIRIPKNRTAIDIIKNTGGIVLTTSANISGERAVTDIKDMSEVLLSEVDGIITDNSILTGVPSTIIKYEEGKIELLREGNINIEKIKKLMKG